MKHNEKFIITDLTFKAKLLQWADQYSHVCILDSQHYKTKDHACYEGSYDMLAAVGCKYELSFHGNAFNDLKSFYDLHSREEQDWLFGYFTYDLKNDIEKLISENEDGIQFPKINFFVPEYLFELYNDHLTISTNNEKSPTRVYEEIIKQVVSDEKNLPSIKLSGRLLKEQYLNAIEKILEHIQYGDIYELNYCQEFFAENISIDSKVIFNKLCEISPAPFSCYLKLRDHYLLCSSPERFLRKQADKIISQPMKGTIQRGKNEEDEQLKLKLFHDEKERSENVMIVDLVRNDLSRIAERGSVKVDELFGIYSYPQVHQMVSSVSCKVKKDTHPVDIIKAAFPMGSMTGAPKIRAMELIEKYEKTKRGLYSGAVGYFSPNGNFDFNVVIRSILYNAMNSYLSVMVGGAITAKANAENEYNECLLKASAMMKALSGE